MLRILMLTAFATMMAGGLQAKEMRRSVEGKAGQDVRLGLFGSVGEDCRPQRTPPVRIVQPPKHGTLIVGTGQTQIPPSGGACAGTSFTVLAIFFRPAVDFTGEDQTVLEFDSADKQVQTVDLTIRP